MNKQDIEKGMKALIEVDSDIARAYQAIGAPPLRIKENSFESLLSIIISQQISTNAASTIMARVSLLVTEMTGEALLKINDQSLRDAGLSWQKVAYAKGLAKAISEQSLNIEKLESQTDEDVITAITNLRGFGRWSAEVYLIFSLNRTDIFPADDLALLISLGRLKRLKDKPTQKNARDLVQHWAPNRSVGALFLWHYYRK